MEINDIKIYINKCNNYINNVELYLESIYIYIKSNNAAIFALYNNIQIYIKDIILYSDIILKYIDIRLNSHLDKLDKFEDNFILKYVDKIGHDIELIAKYLSCIKQSYDKSLLKLLYEIYYDENNNIKCNYTIF